MSTEVRTCILMGVETSEMLWLLALQSAVGEILFLDIEVSVVGFLGYYVSSIYSKFTEAVQNTCTISYSKSMERRWL